MAEECRYYYYQSGYCCALKREKEGSSSIGSDTVHRYCWGYHYEDCPRYKAEHSSGGCFLTSACVEAKGLGDNCHELMVLRHFRDGFMHSKPGGAEDICEYYHIAPRIVERIQQLPNALEVFEKLYNELVIPCVNLIESGRNEEAYIAYRAYSKMLQSQYIEGV